MQHAHANQTGTQSRAAAHTSREQSQKSRAEFARAEKPAAEKSVTTPTETVSPAPGAEPVVQRKIGFEIEVPEFSVYRGTLRMVEQQEEDDDEEGYIGLRAPLLRGPIARRPAVRRPQIVDPKPITKAATMHAGEKWKLTPDGPIAAGWYTEFITDPIDETQNPDDIVAMMTSLRDYVLNSLTPVRMDEYLALSNNYLVKRDINRALTGSFHVTGGIKLGQVFALLGQLSNAANFQTAHVHPNFNAEDSAIMGYATAGGRSAQTGGLSATYKGLVALAGSYVAGQRRIIQQLITHFDVDDFAELLRDHGDELADYAPASGKHLLPVMSRTNLGTLRNKVADMPAAAVFLADVLNAAHLGAGNAADQLFPFGLRVDGAHPGRGIDTQPQMTITQWVTGIYGGADLSWSETQKKSGGAFGTEKVGPEIPTTVLGCIPWTKREEGMIMELRNISSMHPVAEWLPMAQAFAAVFRALNAQ